MKFRVDAQLPRRIKHCLQARGHDSIHTLDLARSNRTSDREINGLSIRDLRVVVTKDDDFVASFVLRREPWKLLLITTGNIDNQAFERLLLANLDGIVRCLETHDFVELSRSAVITHG